MEYGIDFADQGKQLDMTPGKPSGPTLAKLMQRAASRVRRCQAIAPDLPIRVGVDLGTAFTTIMVTDESGLPLAGAVTFADVVRDGIVWDFAGALEVVRTLKGSLEKKTGRTLHRASVTIPPSVNESDHRAHRYVLEGCDLECTAVVDEPTAANALLHVQEGAVVDIGGGTTGVAIIHDGEVVRTFDEPSGGRHLSLTIAGAMDMSLEDAELFKRDADNHRRLLPVVAPVLEKLATIVRDGIRGENIERIYLVGGTVAFSGVEAIMNRVTGIPCEVAPESMLVTPLGVARFAELDTGVRQ